MPGGIWGAARWDGRARELVSVFKTSESIDMVAPAPAAAKRPALAAKTAVTGSRPAPRAPVAAKPLKLATAGSGVAGGEWEEF